MIGQGGFSVIHVDNSENVCPEMIFVGIGVYREGAVGISKLGELEQFVSSKQVKSFG